jgi:predicted nucleotidyltransferase
MFRVAGLIDGVVACNPVVGGVARGDLGPESNAAVLVVFMVPQGGVRGGVVGVPVGVLAAGEGVHV